MLTKLVAAADASSTQLIATTHSLEAVDAVITAVEANKEEDSLSTFWLKRHVDKHEVRRYDFAKLRLLREGGVDIR